MSRLGRSHALWLLTNFADDARLSEREMFLVAARAGGLSWKDVETKYADELPGVNRRLHRDAVIRLIEAAEALR